MSGEIDLASAPLLRAALQQAISLDGQHPTVVDLSEVSFIDSAGLNELLRLLAADHGVVVRRPAESVRRLLEVAGVADSFLVDDDE